MSAAEPACLGCRFFDRDFTRPMGGLCRRRAPTRFAWPSVLADDWCGEFESLADQSQAAPGGHEFIPGNDGREICLCGQKTTDDPRRCPRTILIRDLKLGPRAMRMAARLNAHKLGDLADIGEQRMMSYPNFGVHSLAEIKDALEKHGLALKP